jgi:hypothetical protein
VWYVPFVVAGVFALCEVLIVVAREDRMTRMSIQFMSTGILESVGVTRR